MKRKLLMGALLVSMLLLAGCQPIEKSARDAIAGAKGVTDVLQEQYQAKCQADPTQSECAAINRAGAARNVAIDALEIYCAGPGFDAGTGPCEPPRDKAAREILADKLKAAILDLQRNVGDVRRLVR